MRLEDLVLKVEHCVSLYKGPVVLPLNDGGQMRLRSIVFLVRVSERLDGGKAPLPGCRRRTNPPDVGWVGQDGQEVLVPTVAPAARPPPVPVGLITQETEAVSLVEITYDGGRVVLVSGA